MVVVEVVVLVVLVVVVVLPLDLKYIRHKLNPHAFLPKTPNLSHLPCISLQETVFAMLVEITERCDLKIITTALRFTLFRYMQGHGSCGQQRGALHNASRLSCSVAYCLRLRVALLRGRKGMTPSRVFEGSRGGRRGL